VFMRLYVPADGELTLYVAWDSQNRLYEWEDEDGLWGTRTDGDQQRLRRVTSLQATRCGARVALQRSPTLRAGTGDCTMTTNIQATASPKPACHQPGNPNLASGPQNGGRTHAPNTRTRGCNCWAAIARCSEIIGVFCKLSALLR